MSVMKETGRVSFLVLKLISAFRGFEMGLQTRWLCGTRWRRRRHHAVRCCVVHHRHTFSYARSSHITIHTHTHTHPLSLSITMQGFHFQSNLQQWLRLFFSTADQRGETKTIIIKEEGEKKKRVCGYLIIYAGMALAS